MSINPFSDDLPTQKPSAHQIGQEMADVSIHEIEERIGLLRQEIERLGEILVRKQAAKDAAASAFKI
jgi:uncharacterized small protein (DUF1192 family)